MRDTAIEFVGAHCTVGESPTWHSGEQAWYWVDIPARRIWRLDYGSGALRSWSTDEVVACIAPCAGGGLIAGMESGIFGLDLASNGSVYADRLATPAEVGPGMRFNDGRCDRQGRFWAGTMWMDMAAAIPAGHLYRYEHGAGLSRPQVSGLLTQNGLAWSPDGRTMYLSDSHPAKRRIWSFDYDVETGTPYNRRLFVDMALHAGRPDGAAVDCMGCYWVAGNDGGSLLRFTPAGTLDRELALPFTKPTMPCFGGPELDLMLVTSIRTAQGWNDPDGGAIVLLRPGAQGVPEGPFAG